MDREGAMIPTRLGLERVAEFDCKILGGAEHDGHLLVATERGVYIMQDGKPVLVKLAEKLDEKAP